jgi:hypothetical protein
MKIIKFVHCIDVYGFGLLPQFAAFNFHFLFLVSGLYIHDHNFIVHISVISCRYILITECGVCLFVSYT